jgi:ribose 5-phosphate isomerase B
MMGETTMEHLKIGLATDHGAYEHKEALKEHLLAQGYDVVDFGCFDSSSVDYPDTVYPCALAVSNQEVDAGIVFCGTGIGASIVANKVKGIRCALIHNPWMAQVTKEHNDANVIAMGGRIMDIPLVLECADVWLKTSFSHDARHQQRINKIAALED